MDPLIPQTRSKFVDELGNNNIQMVRNFTARVKPRKGMLENLPRAGYELAAVKWNFHLAVAKSGNQVGDTFNSSPIPNFNALLKYVST